MRLNRTRRASSVHTPSGLKMARRMSKFFSKRDCSCCGTCSALAHPHTSGACSNADGPDADRLHPEAAQSSSRHVGKRLHLEGWRLCRRGKHKAALGRVPCVVAVRAFAGRRRPYQGRVLVGDVDALRRGHFEARRDGELAIVEGRHVELHLVYCLPAGHVDTLRRRPHFAV